MTYPSDLIERCSWEDVADIKLVARAERVIFHPEDYWYRTKDRTAVASLHIRGKGAYLRGAYVYPGHRGVGIGRALVLRRFRDAQNEFGVSWIRTWAYRNRLFEELGFVSTGNTSTGAYRLVWPAERAEKLLARKKS
jgi:GNAT superfamily N-acetyltransferase